MQNFIKSKNNGIPEPKYDNSVKGWAKIPICFR